jgi:hypothetical protein
LRDGAPGHDFCVLESERSSPVQPMLADNVPVLIAGRRRDQLRSFGM